MLICLHDIYQIPNQMAGPGTIFTNAFARKGMLKIIPSIPRTPPSILSLHPTISSPQYITSTYSSSSGKGEPFLSHLFTPGGIIRKTPEAL
mmetsp:Transcript_5227/g.7595  ORF Transcript_5227/g.7595 Transcript_5227/m.7595 type:complete len:91 (+) Transcript_5227:44-316(+)